MAEGEKRGCLGKAIVLVIIIAVLRANLPPDNVAQSLDLGRLESTSGLKGFLGRIAVRGIASEFVADWEYMDLGIVKFAHSERLDITAVGLPFCKWRISKE